MPLEALLGGTYSNISKEERESIYGRGWLLVHYLFMSGERSGQLDRYIGDISKGVSRADATRSAFGELKPPRPPLLPDGTRPGPPISPLIPRHALHATLLAFVHPITNRTMEFTADIPADMRAAMELVR